MKKFFSLIQQIHHNIHKVESILESIALHSREITWKHFELSQLALFNTMFYDLSQDEKESYMQCLEYSEHPVIIIRPNGIIPYLFPRRSYKNNTEDLREPELNLIMTELNISHTLRLITSKHLDIRESTDSCQNKFLFLKDTFRDNLFCE